MKNINAIIDALPEDRRRKVLERAAELAKDMSHTARVAAVVTEGTEIFLMLGEGNHDCQHWRLTESLAKKIRRELNQRLD